MTENAGRRSAAEAVGAVDYPGRGLILGLNASGSCAAAVYFIMGRSENSRNRVFVSENETLRTEAADVSKVSDPSLIIYRAVRRWQDLLIVTNGDQTDTIYDMFTRDGTFAEALRTRSFEPDAPHFTPRISGLLPLKDGKEPIRLGILKAQDAGGNRCARQFFEYAPAPGQAWYLHTYRENGAVLPPFSGEPEAVSLPETADEAADMIWQALDQDNRISLYVRYTDRRTGETRERIVNRFAKEEPRA